MADHNDEMHLESWTDCRTLFIHHQHISMFFLQVPQGVLQVYRWFCINLLNNELSDEIVSSFKYKSKQINFKTIFNKYQWYTCKVCWMKNKFAS